MKIFIFLGYNATMVIVADNLEEARAIYQRDQYYKNDSVPKEADKVVEVADLKKGILIEVIKHL